jgi:hypothetical protein
VESILSRRPWWKICKKKEFKNFKNLSETELPSSWEKKEGINFFWTQIKKDDVIELAGKADRDFGFENFRENLQGEFYDWSEFEFGEEIFELMEEDEELREIFERRRFLFSKEFFREEFLTIEEEQVDDPDTYEYNPLDTICTNHFSNNQILGDKMNLFFSLKKYCKKFSLNLFHMVPLTFVIEVNNHSDRGYRSFEHEYNKRNSKNRENEISQNFWIIKPAEKSNRGRGITVLEDLNKIQNLIFDPYFRHSPKKFIVQEYISDPLLYEKRKFDIRMFMLLTWYNGAVKIYWYRDGYVRTSSKKFTLSNLESKFIHLTNEAVQKKSMKFGKFESGNKITLDELDKFVLEYSKTEEMDIGFYKDILPKMKVIFFP